MTSEPVEMREMATRFYHTLLTEETPSETWRESRHSVLRHVRRTVTDEMQLRLLAPLTSRELLDALRGLVRDSCPGEDGLLPAFFIRYWETLEEGLRLAFQEIMEGGTLPEAISEG